MKFKCPCCGYYTFEEEPKGNYGICPVCFWEDELVLDEDLAGGANRVSLKQARENFKLFGACTEDMKKNVREPLENEMPIYNEEKRIKNVVFDIGGVLADYRLKEFLFAKGFDGDMIKRILKASIMSPYWGQFERGELTEEETLKAFASLDPEIEEELYRAYSSVEGMLSIRDFAIPLVKKLKASGLNVYYLSNYSKKAYDECGESLAFMEYMDGGIVSFKVGKTKPDPEMYKLFLKEYALKPEECIFVDDTEENVDIAKELGFNGVVYISYEDLRSKLLGFGIEIEESQI